jgi:homoserine O-acetyltransferase
MPGSSVKDDVRWATCKRAIRGLADGLGRYRLHYLILQQLEVKSIAAVVGGSMGGMTCLEYPLNTPPGFVRHIIPLATSARHSAWCISWGEAQRQSIYSDPDYLNGYYFFKGDGSGEFDLSIQPSRGLAAARMSALLTYRSRDSFESRFGRRSGGGKGKNVPKMGVRIMGGKETTNPLEPGEGDLRKAAEKVDGAGANGEEDVRERAWREHNDGHRASRRGSEASTPGVEEIGKRLGYSEAKPQPKIFSAQSYLRYQGDKVGQILGLTLLLHC